MAKGPSNPPKVHVPNLISSDDERVVWRDADG